MYFLVSEVQTQNVFPLLWPLMMGTPMTTVVHGIGAEIG